MSNLIATSAEPESRGASPVGRAEPQSAQQDIGDPPSQISEASADASAAAVVSDDRAFLWLRRSDQFIVWLLAVSLLVLLGIHWVRLSRWGIAPVELSSQQPREYYYSLDINTASWVEWAQLDGIGEKLARRIVADRDDRGLFRNPGDVDRVRGIGPHLMEKIRPFLRGGTESVTDQPMP